VAHARTLFPLRNGSSFPIAEKSAADALSVRFASGFRAVCEIAVLRSQSPKPPIVAVVFHRESCSEFAARAVVRASVHRRTDAEHSPNTHRTDPHAAATAPIPHLRATLDGSTRLREERPTAPGGNP
jgi:hypothetical protein